MTGKAGEHLAVAKKLMAEHPRHAAFNVEQAAEKLLKAVLTAEPPFSDPVTTNWAPWLSFFQKIICAGPT